MTAVRIFQADAFASVPFAGNPAAVVLVPFEKKFEDADMLKIAAEMNLSETAFVSLLHANDTFERASAFNLRWFTPKREVPLCGHATMASAAILFYQLDNKSDSLSFHTLSGELKAVRDGEYIAMDLPAAPPVHHDYESVKHVVRHAIADLPVHSCLLSSKGKKLLVRLADSVTREQLEALQPDAAAMLREETNDEFRGIIVTTTGKGKPGNYDFISRYFGPWNLGLANFEDPVTGSAHTLLAPYWAEQLVKTELTARQCSPRGGDLCIVVDGDVVRIAGPAVVIFAGTLFV